MATEKILNTRLQLKYDTLANWNSSTFIPKKGEACIVEVPTGTSVTGVVNPPAIMIKVGNGTDKFSALPWTAATAADVYTWAKKNQLPVEVVDNGTGTFVTDVVGAWDATNNKYTLTLSRSNVGMTITEATGTNDGKYVTGLVWDKTTETLKPQMVAFDATLSDTSTNAPQTQAVKAAIDAAKKYADDNEKTTSVSNTADKVIKVTSKTTGNNTDYALDFQYDNSGNVKFEETTNGLKATVSITDVKVDKAVYADEAGKATNDGNGKNIASTYATKAEIEAKDALWSKDTVTSVYGEKAIEVTNTTAGDPNYKVALKINDGTPGNVTLSQDANGLKASTTPAAIGAVSTSEFNTFKTSNTTAINTAASTAKTEAISAASTDASTKANTAESNAKKYTDDEIVGLELEHSGQNIILKNKAGTTVATLDASAFYVDGMVSNATYDATTNKLTITFNTASGKNAIDVDLNDLVDVYTGGTGITVGTDGKISISNGGVTATQLASNAVTTAKITDKNVTKAKLAEDVQTSLGKADTAVQEITWQTGTVSPTGNQGATYILSVDGQMTGNSLTTPEYVETAIELVTGEIGDKTVKKYVDDAVASVVAGEVKNAEYATEAGHATKATQDASGNVITSTYETKTDAAQKLTDAKAYTDAEIKKLDVSDTAKTNQYVSAVSETDGKISVSRTALPVYSVTVEDGVMATDTVSNGVGAGTNSTKNIKVNGSTIGTFLTSAGVADYISDAIGGLNSAAGYDSGATSDGSHAPALTSFTIENGKVSSYKTNENLTGFIEDLDQREGTILVFDCGSATKNI